MTTHHRPELSSWGARLGVYLRGLAMGAADIVPGVSGGTVALITGIYDRLVAAIAAFDLGLLPLLRQGRWRDIWVAIDGLFLVCLLMGIATAVVTLANVIHGLMAYYPLPLWSFFFGLVLASAVVLRAGECPGTRAVEWVWLLVGVVVAALIGLSPQVAFFEGSLGFLLAGSLAICAMILPGISGSFILLLIGMYAPVIGALTGMQFDLIAVFAVGCVLGLLLFSRLLNWVLNTARRITMATLSGFLLGSLVTLWPWQQVVTTVVDRHGDERPVQTVPISPITYAMEQGDSQWLLCGVMALVGIAVVLLSHRFANTEPSQASANRTGANEGG